MKRILPFLILLFIGIGCATIFEALGLTGAATVIRDPKTGKVIEQIAPLFGPLGIAAASILGLLGVGKGTQVAIKHRRAKKALKEKLDPDTLT